MKRIFIPILLIILMVACKSNSSNSSKDSPDNKAKNTIEKTNSPATLALIKRFKPFFNGVWVRTDYINGLKKTMSPYVAGGLGGVAGMDIELAESGIDSTHIGYSLGNHEGSDFVLYFKNGILPNTMKTNLTDYDSSDFRQELGYSIKNKDTSLILYLLNRNNQIKQKTFYTKVADQAKDKNDVAWGIQYVTNKILIAGKYIMLDSTGTNSKAEFNNDGNCFGFGEFNKYDIQTDFTVGPGNKVDQIFFNVYTPKQKIYSFQIKADTLNLFEINNIDTEDEDVGMLKYKLVRQK